MKSLSRPGRKITAKTIGAVVLLLLGFILAIGYPTGDAFQKKKPIVVVQSKARSLRQPAPLPHLEKRQLPTRPNRQKAPQAPIEETEEEGC